MAPRSTAERIADTQRLLAESDDCWVATASPTGAPYLVPLSHVWDGTALTMVTPAGSVTARNARAGGMRLALGPTRDVVMIDGETEVLELGDAPARADAFAARTGWDVRGEKGEHVLLVFTPTRVQAWREVDELPGRTIMLAGAWLA